MKLRTLVVVGAAAAFLFGTEQGRALVDKVQAQVKKAWEDPSVQDKVREYTGKAADFAKETSAQVRDVVSDAAQKASSYVQDAADEVR